MGLGLMMITRTENDETLMDWGGETLQGLGLVIITRTEIGETLLGLGL